MIIGSDWGELGALYNDPRYSDDMKQWFLDAPQFARLFKDKQSRFFCLLDEDKLPELKGQGLGDFHIVRKAYGRLLISNG